MKEHRKKHNCGCVTYRGIYVRKCTEAVCLTQELDWAYEDDAPVEQNYWARKLHEHVNQ